MEYREGCPACEHTDPQLERELQALAQLLTDSYLESCEVGVHQRPKGGVDIERDQVRLKEVDNPSSADE